MEQSPSPLSSNLCSQLVKNCCILWDPKIYDPVDNRETRAVWYCVIMKTQLTVP